MNRPVLILGAGGHAHVLADALLMSGRKVVGMVDPDEQLHSKVIMGITVLGSDMVVSEFDPCEVELVNGIGSVASLTARKQLFLRFSRRGYRFATVIHPSSIIARETVLGEGVQLAAGSIIQTGTHLGDNTLINTGASVDHDCCIGAHVHIAPGCTLSGGVRVGNGVHVGCGATIVQGVQLGDDSLVAAGAVVIADVAKGTRVGGVPAKELRAR